MGLLLNGGAQDGGRFCFGVVREAGKWVSRSNNGGAQNRQEIVLVGVASVMERKADDRVEIQRWKAKDGEQSMESSLKQNY